MTKVYIKGIVDGKRRQETVIVPEGSHVIKTKHAYTKLKITFVNTEYANKGTVK